MNGCWGGRSKKKEEFNTTSKIGRLGTTRKATARGGGLGCRKNEEGGKKELSLWETAITLVSRKAPLIQRRGVMV